MSSWRDSFFDWSEKVESIPETSSAGDISGSDSAQSDHSYHPEEQTPGGGTPSYDTIQTPNPAHPIIHASRKSSAKSTGNEYLFYSGSDGSVLGSTPGSSAARESGGHASSASSSVFDPILEHFALYTPPASSAASFIQRVSTPSVLSDETAGSDETDSSSSESSRNDEALGTPATSDASHGADIVFAADQDHENQEFEIPNEQALVGLELAEEYQVEPLFCRSNAVTAAEILSELLESLRNEKANPQEEIPWIPGIQDNQWTASQDSILAPPPGPVYHEYYSLTRDHVQRHKRHEGRERKTQRERKAASAGRRSQHIPLASPCDNTSLGTPGYDTEIPSHLLAGTTQDWPNRYTESLRLISQPPKIYRSVDCVNFSLETLGSIFFPSFALSHLSSSSVSAFTTKLVAPDSLAYDTEHSINLSLGFGPFMCHKVCLFTPRNNEDLKSYQKHQGEEKLSVQNSLPILLNIFSLDSHAEELDVWLNYIIDSESGVQEYVDLMQRQHKNSVSVQVLRCTVQWYAVSKAKLLEPAHGIFRAAFKLLITTTLLRLVPRLKNLPASLSGRLYPQSSARESIRVSTDAPKLLTRQVKASIHRLQQDLLHDIFCHFTCASELNSENKAAIALLLASVLDMVRNAGRQFAKYASGIDPTIKINQKDVTQYETNMQRQIFERVRASLDSEGDMGRLGEGLRKMSSIAKGKGKEDEECQLLSVILDDMQE